MAGRVLLWALPGCLVWIALLVVSSHLLTGRRNERMGFAFVPLALVGFVGLDFLLGWQRSAEVDAILLIAGFPVAAIYLAYLLVAEFVEQRRSRSAGVNQVVEGRE